MLFNKIKDKDFEYISSIQKIHNLTEVNGQNYTYNHGIFLTILAWKSQQKMI